MKSVQRGHTGFPRAYGVALAVALLVPAAAVDVAVADAQSPLTISRCDFAVLGSVYHGGEALVDVEFVDRDPRDVVSVTFEAPYSSASGAPTIVFLDEGHFGSGVTVRHTLQTRLASRRKPTYWRDPARCAVTRVRFADGSSWERPATESPPPRR